jgi:hypothetical protein
MEKFVFGTCLAGMFPFLTRFFYLYGLNYIYCLILSFLHGVHDRLGNVFGILPHIMELFEVSVLIRGMVSYCRPATIVVFGYGIGKIMARHLQWFTRGRMHLGTYYNIS